MSATGDDQRQDGKPSDPRIYSPSDPYATSGTLLLRLKARGPSGDLAWEEFHARYAPMIGGFARKMGAPAGDVDDIVQDVLLAFFSTSANFTYDPRKGRFRGFLKTCTFHAMIKRGKKNAKWSGVPLDQVDPHSVEVDKTWDDVWEQELLRRAIEKTREQYSTTEASKRTFRAFELYVLKERDADEVARELKVTRDVVHQAKHRVSEALGHTLQKLRDSEG